jgi:hypothetical protein
MGSAAPSHDEPALIMLKIGIVHVVGIIDGMRAIAGNWQSIGVREHLVLGPPNTFHDSGRIRWWNSMCICPHPADWLMILWGVDGRHQIPERLESTLRDFAL